MSNVHAAATWTATCVEEKGIATLVSIEDLIEVTVAEEESSSQPAVGLVAGELGEPLQECLVD